MTRFAPLWQQNNSYPAAIDRSLIGALWPNSAMIGGVVTVATGTMNVNVAAGTAAVALPNNQSVLCRWDASEVVTVSTAPASGQSRIDLIVLQVRDVVLDSGTNNDFIFQAIAGVATTGTPVPPTAPNNSMVLYQVTVAGGAANLNGAVLTDKRPLGSMSLGGIVTAVPGTVAMFAGGALPTGWLWCDGSAISRTTYAALFAAIGGYWGTGDGTGTFNVPDLRSRVPIGAGAAAPAGLTPRNLGVAGGEENHVLTVNELASHNHDGMSGAEDRDHDHGVPPGSTGYVGTYGAGWGPVNGGAPATGGPIAASGIERTKHLHPIAYGGASWSHNNMQPYAGINYMIKT